MARIGVFLCWCGENIARTVDVAQVAELSARIPGVRCALDYKYMCSDPGQSLMREKIASEHLDRVVVASCSPHMHLKTFRKAAERAGLNPYLVEMANIREHCSWVHPDREQATAKAAELVRMSVEKVRHNAPLVPIKVPVTRRALVIGGGVAGIQAALDIADGGYEVVMVEREPSIGGKMAGLSETFPTLDCSQCILTPRMVEVGQHPRIKLYTYSEVEAVDGFVGNFTITIRNKARYVDIAKCTGCGECWNVCPLKKNPQRIRLRHGQPPGHLRTLPAGSSGASRHRQAQSAPSWFATAAACARRSAHRRHQLQGRRSPDRREGRRHRRGHRLQALQHRQRAAFGQAARLRRVRLRQVQGRHRLAAV